MKIEKLKPGMIVYDVGRHKMGNTTLSTVSVWEVEIESIDIQNELVRAHWNHNNYKDYGKHIWSKWRIKEPLLIRTAMGSYRLATRGEIKESKESMAKVISQ